jgi:hypothetical protein
MADLEREIALLQQEIGTANEAIAEAIRARRAVNKDSPLIIDLNAAVVAARQALTNVEIKLRKLYESKSDD